MSSSVDITIDITIPRVEGLSKSQVESFIKEKEEDLRGICQKLLMFTSANPRDIVPTDWDEEPIRWLRNQVVELLNDYETILKEEIGLLHYLEVYDQYNRKDNE